MAEKDVAATPMMRQFYELKAKHPDAVLLFRCGDFYETYCSDAVVASEILGITLTKRSNGKSDAAKAIEMAGFPFHALDTYLPKLVRAGKRVAQYPGKVGENIPKVARRHNEVDCVTHLDLTGRNQIDVRGEIISDLRCKTTEVDGICTGKAYTFFRQLFIKFFGSKQTLYRALTIVKIALHRGHAYVVSVLNAHLQTLHFCNAFVGIEHRYLRTRYVAEALQRRFTSIAAGRRQNEDIVLYARHFAALF